MTRDEAREFIRRYCRDVDEGLEELRQQDAQIEAVRSAAIETILRAVEQTRAEQAKG